MKRWKKYTSLLLALVLCLCLTACGGGKADLPDISGYTGCWKVENEPLYFVINDSCEWAAVNLYGEEIGPGYVVAEEDFITLCMENGEEAATSLIKGNRLAGISWITGMFEENDRCPCEHSV